MRWHDWTLVWALLSLVTLGTLAMVIWVETKLLRPRRGAMPADGQKRPGSDAIPADRIEWGAIDDAQYHRLLDNLRGPQEGGSR